MPTVTVEGAHGQTVSLCFDSEATAVRARKLAAAITAGVQGGSIIAATDTDGRPPPVPPGKTGEFVQTLDHHVTFLPDRYKALVNTADSAIVFGAGETDQSVLSSGTGDLTLIEHEGSGTVAAGGGDNRILIGREAGPWLIATGNG